MKTGDKVILDNYKYLNSLETKSIHHVLRFLIVFREYTVRRVVNHDIYLNEIPGATFDKLLFTKIN